MDEEGRVDHVCITGDLFYACEGDTVTGSSVHKSINIRDVPAELTQDLNLYIPEHVNVDEEYLILDEIPVEAIREYWEVSANDWDTDDTSEDGEDSGGGKDSDESDEDGSSNDRYYHSGDEYD